MLGFDEDAITYAEFVLYAVWCIKTDDTPM